MKTEKGAAIDAGMPGLQDFPMRTSVHPWDIRWQPDMSGNRSMTSPIHFTDSGKMPTAWASTRSLLYALPTDSGRWQLTGNVFLGRIGFARSHSTTMSCAQVMSSDSSTTSAAHVGRQTSE